MEIFFPRLPENNRRSIWREVAKATHDVFGKKIAFEWRQVGKNSRQGVLTFPTPEIGQRFLNRYRSRLRLRDHSGKLCDVEIRLSNKKPNERLVEGLQRAMEEIMKASDSEDDAPEGLNGIPRTDVSYVIGRIQCRCIEWGVWTSDGAFGQCGKTSRGKPRIVYSPETGELNVVDIEEAYHENTTKTGIAIDNVTIQEILIHRDRVHTRLFLSLDRIPRFWSERVNRHREKDIVDDDFVQRVLRLNFHIFQDLSDRHFYRIPALCSEHTEHARYCTVYVFELEGPNLDKRLRKLFKSMKRHIPAGTSSQITTVPFNLTHDIDQLASLYLGHHYRVAFQMESLVRNRRLLPNEVIDLNDHIRSCEQKNDINETVRILQSFASDLPPRTLESVYSLDLIDLFQSKQISRSERIAINQNAAWIHRLNITPATDTTEGPEWMGSNRVLRLFPEHHDYFLKVAFLEEDLLKIRPTRDFDVSSVLRGTWTDALNGRINLAGRQFEFLGFSNSSLREHSVWFLAPFERDGKIITAESLRSQLGDFSHIHCPPRYASRLGQTFTTTTHALELAPEEVGEIEDVSHGGYIFSDGVGTVSQAMLERIWKVTSADNDEVKPVVYQIRLGGSKGVLSLDRSISGCQILLRPSMTKFPAQNTHLELVNKGKPLPLFLNRQLIVILESLNLPHENFVRLLDEEIGHLEKASWNFEDALQLAQRYGLGQASRYPTILRVLKELGVESIFKIPFFRRLNSLALTHALKQLKYRSRIPADVSWKLIGVMDEFEYLKEGEIYVCIKNETDGIEQVLKGDTMVTRSPALHCGDVQIVRAIRPTNPDHPLSSLYNCIVFSSEGRRPTPNMLAGGDLDGDLFDVSQNPLLFPPNREPPDSYPPITPKDLGRQCTIYDVAQFFLNFIVNDNIGTICSRHAILADQSQDGALRQECVQFSRLASTAVDFPKTGVPVDLKHAPYVNTRVKPDFMAQQPLNERDFIPEPPSHTNQSSNLPDYSGIRPDRTLYYKSNKILGKMYRGVDIETLLKKWNANSGRNESGPMKLWEQIERNLQRLNPPHQTTWADDIQEARGIFLEYMKDLEWIQWYFHPTPGGERRLSEAEVFLQCIRIDPSARFVRGRGNDEYLHGLRKAYTDIISYVRSAVWGQIGGRYRRAAACFYVGINHVNEKKSEGESFAWIVIPELFEAWKKVEENGFVDDDLGDSRA